MKCDLCLKEKWGEDIEIITRKTFEIEYIGYICKRCKQNFYDYPNRIIKDYSGKYWYISDERKFGNKAKLTFSRSIKQTFMEFNPEGRTFILKTGEKVAYYWIIEKGIAKFRSTHALEGFKKPIEVYKARRK
ncbi:MAG: hypothetical protein ABDH49_08560 [Candidatus Hydrothermales bacterium]